MFRYDRSKLPRGLRFNNPGNLKELENDRTQWKGERATDDDPIFEEFISDKYGIRAIGKVLDSYARRGIDTIEEIITVYAPSFENQTEQYIRSVSASTGFNRHATISRSRGHYPDLVAAIIHHEQGMQPFPKEFIIDSLEIA